MKDKEFDTKIMAYLLGEEELFDEEELDETDDWDEYYKQEDYDYNHERGEDNWDDEEED